MTPGDVRASALSRNETRTYRHSGTSAACKLRHQLKSDLKNYLAKSTSAVYHREWDKFCQFMDSVIIQSSCPASSKSIALYVTHLKRDKNYKVSSIKTSLSAISYNHKMKCFTNPRDSFMIEKLLLSNQKSEKPTVQKPITLAVLQQIISYIRDSHSYQKLLFNAIFPSCIMVHSELVRCVKHQPLAILCN